MLPAVSSEGVCSLASHVDCMLQVVCMVCQYAVDNIPPPLQPVEMHFDALRSLTQPCLTANCIQRHTPMIQALYHARHISVSLGKCI